MIHVAISPSPPEATCLSIPNLLSNIPLTLAPHLTITTTPTPLTTALLFLPTPAHPDPASSLLKILSSYPSIRFVQLPMTGVDQFTSLIRSLISEKEIVFCCAKSCYGQVVAEHALALSLSLLRGLHLTPPSAAGEVETLFDARVLIVGSGSID
ncbi:2-Hacid_dh_C domain-containing protein [Pseudozyma hubeiensis]|nr:2-Hacid_dh_C domain-containing protein [Pseudozyma hubeiensis]